MAFQKITENVENITLLANTPAISVENLKKEFDKGSKTIKTKFNQLVDDLNEMIIQEDGTPDESNIYSSEASQKLFGKTVLYENSEGTHGNIILSETAANFDYIEIFFDTPYGMKSVKVHEPNNKYVLLDGHWLSDKMRFWMKEMKIENSTITKTSSRTFSIDNSTTWTPYGSDNDAIKIYKVVGYTS